MAKYLILGGARSGKSTFAEGVVERLAKIKCLNKVYLATATADDNEMACRIERHQLSRDENWRLIEEPISVAQIIHKLKKDDCLLIDCLTLWLSNCLHKDCWSEQRESFFNALAACQANIVMVSNEVGGGVVPIGALSRQFVDESGWLHQKLAKQCDHVSVIVAGLENKLK